MITPEAVRLLNCRSAARGQSRARLDGRLRGCFYGHSAASCGAESILKFSSSIVAHPKAAINQFNKATEKAIWPIA